MKEKEFKDIEILLSAVYHRLSKAYDNIHEDIDFGDALEISECLTMAREAKEIAQKQSDTGAVVVTGTG